jgi:hypothetical protein
MGTKWNKILEVILEKKSMGVNEYKTLEERIESLENQLYTSNRPTLAKGESRLEKRIESILKYITIGNDYITIQDSEKGLSYNVDSDGIHCSLEGNDVNRVNKKSKICDFIVTPGKASDANFGDLFICNDPSEINSTAPIGIVAVDADKYIGVQYLYDGLIRWNEWDHEEEGLIFKRKM